MSVEYFVSIALPGKGGHVVKASVADDERAAYAVYDSFRDLARCLYPSSVVKLRYVRREKAGECETLEKRGVLAASSHNHGLGVDYE